MNQEYYEQHGKESIKNFNESFNESLSNLRDISFKYYYNWKSEISKNQNLIQKLNEKQSQIESLQEKSARLEQKIFEQSEQFSSSMERFSQQVTSTISDIQLNFQHELEERENQLRIDRENFDRDRADFDIQKNLLCCS